MNKNNEVIAHSMSEVSGLGSSNKPAFNPWSNRNLSADKLVNLSQLNSSASSNAISLLAYKIEQDMIDKRQKFVVNFGKGCAVAQYPSKTKGKELRVLCLNDGRLFYKGVS